MESITKTLVTKEQIVKMAERAFGTGVQINSVEELTEGYFNAGYLLKTAEQHKYVLKIAPSPHVTVMRYEKDIMDMEVHVLKLIEGIGTVPAPKVLFYDDSKELIPTNYFFMEFLEGKALYQVRSNVSEDAFAKISRELGQHVKAMKIIGSDSFGYVLQPDRSYGTWSECFLSMIDEILADAKDQKVVLPYTYDEIRDMFHKHKAILDEVDAPVLVHKDLWEGNIFVDEKTATITGIIDCERALFGDPIMEIDCGLLRGNKEFLKAFLERDTLTESEAIRSNLYNVYLYLLIVVEIPFRKYPDPRMEEWGRDQLNKAFDVLLHGGCDVVFDFQLGI